MTLRKAWAWIAVALAIAVAADAARTFPTQAGIDFYHLWGVPMGQRASAVPISPYAATHEYAALLNALAEQSPSQALRNANRFKREIAPTGTPLFYAAFSFLPDDYGAAHVLFAVLQYVAGAAAVYLLARLRGAPRAIALCIAFAVELTFNPFVQDVKWGNATAFQLLFIAACLHASARGWLARHAGADRLFIAALAAFVMFKPNTIWIAAALALHYAVLRGMRRTLVGAALALPAAAVAWGAGAGYFHDAAIWNEWLAYVRGGALVYRFQEGNQSWPMLFAQLSPLRSANDYALLVSLLAAGIVAALLLRGGAEGFARRARVLFADPYAAASIGVLFTLAASPLVWPYYHLFALLPMAWVFRAEGRWDAPSACAVASYAALSSPVLAVLLAADQLVALRLLMFLSWLPLVPAAAMRAGAVLAGAPATTAATGPAAR
jgi:hypothetical protein